MEFTVGTSRLMPQTYRRFPVVHSSRLRCCPDPQRRSVGTLASRLLDNWPSYAHSHKPAKTDGDHPPGREHEVIRHGHREQ